MGYPTKRDRGVTVKITMKVLECKDIDIIQVNTKTMIGICVDHPEYDGFRYQPNCCRACDLLFRYNYYKPVQYM